MVSCGLDENPMDGGNLRNNPLIFFLESRLFLLEIRDIYERELLHLGIGRGEGGVLIGMLTFEYRSNLVNLCGEL